MKANIFFFVCLFLIILLFFFASLNKPEKLREVRVISYPSLFKNFKKIKVIDEKTKKTYFLYFNQELEIDLGDKLVLTDFSLKDDKIYFPRQIKIYKHKNLLLGLANRLRNFYDFQIQKNLPWPEENILRGILFGEKIEDEELYQIFQKTGTAHILVASGGNLVLISSIFFLIFKNLKFFDFKLVLVFLIFFLGFYTLLVGFEGSIIRAFIFSVFLIFLKNFGGRIPLKRNLILLSIILLLIFFPYFLLELGTILSFASFLAIIYLSPFIEKRIENFLKNKFLAENLGQTLSVYLFIFPITNYYFQNLTLYSFLFNPLVLLLVPYVFIFGFLFSYLPYFSLISLPPLWVLKNFLLLANYLPSINFSLPLIFYLIYYLFLFIFVYKINKNENPEFNFSFR